MDGLIRQGSMPNRLAHARRQHLRGNHHLARRDPAAAALRRRDRLGPLCQGALRGAVSRARPRGVRLCRRRHRTRRPRSVALPLCAADLRRAERAERLPGRRHHRREDARQPGLERRPCARDRALSLRAPGRDGPRHGRRHRRMHRAHRRGHRARPRADLRSRRAPARDLVHRSAARAARVRRTRRRKRCRGRFRPRASTTSAR